MTTGMILNTYDILASSYETRRGEPAAFKSLTSVQVSLFHPHVSPKSHKLNHPLWHNQSAGKLYNNCMRIISVTWLKSNALTGLFKNTLKPH